jgi:phosphatidylinositol glycan class S
MFTNTESVYGLTREDLTVFVNSAEWSLCEILMSLMSCEVTKADSLPASSVSDDPVLHFVLFVPAAGHRPLHILDSNGEFYQSRQ